MSGAAVVKEGNLLSIKTPKMLSLVGKPANQVAFKIVRSEDGPKGETNVTKPPLIRRARRSDPSSGPILALSFPATYEDEAVQTVLKSFGLEAYNVQRSDDGILAVRPDLKSTSIPADAQTIPLTTDGIVASVVRAAATEPATEPVEGEKNQIAIASLVFREDKFTASSVGAWLESNGFGGAEIKVQLGDENSFVVTRSNVPEGEETHVVELDDGVSATIVRAGESNVPDAYVSGVNETAYGNWGWGHLDFAATMADVAFSEKMREGVSRLEDVLRNILFYSSLALSDRQALVANALTQFGAFANSLMDSLPRQVIAAVARSANATTLEKVNMTQDARGAATDTITVSRSELNDMITNGVVAAMAKRDADAAAAADKAKADAAAAAERETEVKRSVTALVEEAVKPLKETIEKLTGSTVVRSDNSDEKSKDEVAGDGKTKTKDVFRGALPGVSRFVNRPQAKH